MKNSRVKNCLGVGLLVMLVACLLVTGGLALSNAGLPGESSTTDKLSSIQKTYLEEALHLRQSLGGQVWPDWDQADIPMIVYNEAYAFLVGYPDPPAGWLKMPSREVRGTAWEVVPGDTFRWETYYRQPLPDPNITPEAFTVLVGERWVASLPTREYMQVSFYRDFRQELPVFLQPVFPYRLMWNLLMGSTDSYIEGLNHEAFHAYQGVVNPERFAQAEEANRFANQYPFDDSGFESAWEQELKLALDALQADSQAEALELTRQFWQARQQRREDFNLSPEHSAYEREREWLEGLAKYAELALGRLAGSSTDYSPLPAVLADPDFKAYSNQERFWQQQLTEAVGSALRSGETRFYYSGLVQAALLDRLAPGWQSRTLTTGLALEDLLREQAPLQP